MISSLKSYIAQQSISSVSLGVAQILTSEGFYSSENSVNRYINSLKNFQSSGVVVYALSNTYSFSDADFQAALPELFPQLKDAWITVVNVEITGTIDNKIYTRKSGPSGSTAQYSLCADGWRITGSAHKTFSNNFYWKNVSGTSFAAPQVSGAIALLAQAFPNDTPQTWRDRLLASADNSMCRPFNGYVTFSNGVKHGYNREFGHGVIDIKAALEEIKGDIDL